MWDVGDVAPLAPGGKAPRGYGTNIVWHLNKFSNSHNFVIFYARNLRFCMEIHSDFFPLQPGDVTLRGFGTWACVTEGVWHISKFVKRHNFVFFYARNLRFCMEINSDFLPLQPGGLALS